MFLYNYLCEQKGMMTFELYFHSLFLGKGKTPAWVRVMGENRKKAAVMGWHTLQMALVHPCVFPSIHPSIHALPCLQSSLCTHPSLLLPHSVLSPFHLRPDMPNCSQLAFFSLSFTPPFSTPPFSALSSLCLLCKLDLGAQDRFCAV